MKACVVVLTLLDLKKSLISALVVLITISLVGLFSIQVYWIKNSIALRDAQFRRNVRVSLSEVNRVLAYQEKLERLQKHEYGKDIILHFDSLRTVLHPADSSRKNNRTDKGRTYEESIDKYFKEEQEAIQSVIQKSMRLEEYQSEEIAQLLLDISMSHSGSSFLSTYGEDRLDSLLNTALQEVGGITTGFEFGIFDRHDIAQIVPVRSVSHVENLVKKGYRARLLPDDYVNPDTYLYIWFPNQDSYLLKTLWPLVMSSVIFLVLVVVAFGYTIRTIVRQKKISDIKNDFISNVTHELKTPIATISLACEALKDPAMSAAPQKVDKFVKMINEENKRLGILVENVLRSAVLDKSEMGVSREDIDLHEVIEMVIRNIELQAKRKGGTIEKSLEAAQPKIRGDKIHLTNVVFNLIDNAVKYSNDKPEVTVKTYNKNNTIYIEVSDRGIGIKKEDQKRIFEKLYRVPTGDIHNIKGFGLGLSYVKSIVDKHHGAVSVQSEYGKGSKFIIQLPLNYEL